MHRQMDAWRSAGGTAAASSGHLRLVTPGAGGESAGQRQFERRECRSPGAQGSRQGFGRAARGIEASDRHPQFRAGRSAAQTRRAARPHRRRRRPPRRRPWRPCLRRSRSRRLQPYRPPRWSRPRRRRRPIGHQPVPPPEASVAPPLPTPAPVPPPAKKKPVAAPPSRVRIVDRLGCRPTGGCRPRCSWSRYSVRSGLPPSKKRRESSGGGDLGSLMDETHVSDLERSLRQARRHAHKGQRLLRRRGIGPASGAGLRGRDGPVRRYGRTASPRMTRCRAKAPSISIRAILWPRRIFTWRTACTIRRPIWCVSRSSASPSGATCASSCWRSISSGATRTPSCRRPKDWRPRAIVRPPASGTRSSSWASRFARTNRCLPRAAGSGRGAGALVDLNLEGGENRVDIDLFGDPDGERSSLDHPLAKDTDDTAATGESPGVRSQSGLDFTLDAPERGADDSPTREMPPRDEPTVEAELMNFADAPTTESPALKTRGNARSHLLEAAARRRTRRPKCRSTISDWTSITWNRPVRLGRQHFAARGDRSSRRRADHGGRPR